MKTISSPFDYSVTVEALREWFSILAQKDFERAFAFLTPRGSWPEGPAAIRDAIGKYNPNFEKGDPRNERYLPQVGNPDSYRRLGVRGEWFHFREFDELIDGKPGVEIHFQIPLDGKWSDLWAVFGILPIKDSSEWGISLLSIHVP